MDNRQHIFDFDENKICIVINVTDLHKYDITLKSLQKLNVPQGKEIELCEIFDAETIGAAYNQAIKQSNAKYKVYIQEGTQILNKNILFEFIDLFTTEYKVGIAGISGYEYIPVTCDASHTVRHYGRIHNASDNENYDWMIPEKAFKEVAFLDNYFIATQYDILWDEEYNSPYFAVMSQSMQLKREGYSSLVINTGKYDISVSECNFKFHIKEVEIFKENYYKEAFPLVSILIPTHNRPEYLKIALESAINQTYKNLEIIVSDDSDDDRTYKLMQGYMNDDSRIRYFYHRGIASPINHNVLSDNYNGEYVNWLMDDDALYHNKIEKMIDFYREYDNVKLVTSYRQAIDGDGKELNVGLPSLDLEKTTVIDGHSVIKEIISNAINFIGEPTTVLLCSKYIKPIDKMYLSSSLYQGIFYRKTIQWDMGTTKLYGMTDIMTWFSLLQDGDLVFIPENLSMFRIHEGQGQRVDENFYRGIHYISMILALHYFVNNGIFSKDEFLYIINKFYGNLNYKDFMLSEMHYNNVDYSEAFMVCWKCVEEEIRNEKIIDIFKLYEF